MECKEVWSTRGQSSDCYPAPRHSLMKTDKCDTQLSGTNLNFITAKTMYIYCKD